MDNEQLAFVRMHNSLRDIESNPVTKLVFDMGFKMGEAYNELKRIGLVRQKPVVNRTRVRDQPRGNSSNDNAKVLHRLRTNSQISVERVDEGNVAPRAMDIDDSTIVATRVLIRNDGNGTLCPEHSKAIEVIMVETFDGMESMGPDRDETSAPS